VQQGEIMRRGDNSSVAILFIFGIALAFVLFFSFTPAFPHDFWTDGHAVDPKTKALCCGQDDCHLITPDRVHITSEGFVLNLKGAWAADKRYPALAPPDEPVTVEVSRMQPSPDREYWLCYWGGDVKCFFGPFSGV
jgi:hypothetical protein